MIGRSWKTTALWLSAVFALIVIGCTGGSKEAEEQVYEDFPTKERRVLNRDFPLSCELSISLPQRHSLT